jgi:hypothetical protein
VNETAYAFMGAFVFVRLDCKNKSRRLQAESCRRINIAVEKWIELERFGQKIRASDIQTQDANKKVEQMQNRTKDSNTIFEKRFEQKIRTKDSNKRASSRAHNSCLFIRELRTKRWQEGGINCKNIVVFSDFWHLKNRLAYLWRNSFGCRPINPSLLDPKRSPRISVSLGRYLGYRFG